MSDFCWLNVHGLNAMCSKSEVERVFWQGRLHTLMSLLISGGFGPKLPMRWAMMLPSVRLLYVFSPPISAKPLRSMWFSSCLISKCMLNNILQYVICCKEKLLTNYLKTCYYPTIYIKYFEILLSINILILVGLQQFHN